MRIANISLNLEKKYVEIFFYGIISGMPLAVLITIISAWLKELDIPLSTITTIGISRISYGFKYLWAPIIDNFNIPIISSFGRRRSWMFFSAAIMGFLMMSFTFIDPVKDFSLLLYISVLFGFFSATFDIAFDAFRIDSISKEKQGYASACAVMGYRIGMIIAGTLGLILSDFYSWNHTFMLIGVIFFISLIYIPFLTEPKLELEQYKTIIEKVKASVIEPFKDFLTRKNALIILFAVIIYKLGGVLLSLVSIPFYLELGYSKIQVAAIAKFIGLFATIFGSFIGGYFVAQAGHLSALIICGIIQALVHSCFIWLHHAPVEHFSLLITIIIENLGSGAGTTAEVAYLSYLCNKKYSATQYALLSSLAVLMNSIISIKSGSIVDLIGWDLFFILTVLLSFPAIIIFAYLRKQE